MPAETIQRYLRGGWSAYVLAAAMAIPIYVCDGGEAPLTRALLETGVGSGPAFCFMFASVGMCILTISMATHLIGWRAIAIYLGAWLVLAARGEIIMAALTA